MKNNDNITKEKEIKLLRNEIYGLVIERDTLVKINQQLHDNLETLRNDNLQLIEQIALMHDNKTCQYRMILSPADAALVRELTGTKGDTND